MGIFIYCFLLLSLATPLSLSLSLTSSCTPSLSNGTHFAGPAANRAGGAAAFVADTSALSSSLWGGGFYGPVFSGFSFVPGTSIGSLVLQRALNESGGGEGEGEGEGEGQSLHDLDGTKGIGGLGDQWSILSSTREETSVATSPSISLRATFFSPYLGPEARTSRKRADAASRRRTLGISHLGTPALIRASAASSSLPDDTVLLESDHSFALYACVPASTDEVVAQLAAIAADAARAPAYCRALCGLDSTTYIKLANASLDGPITVGQARTWAARGSSRYLDRGNSIVYTPVTRVHGATEAGTTSFATASMVVLPPQYDCFAATDAVSVASGGRTDRLDPRFRASGDVSLSRQSSLPAMHGSALSTTNERCAHVLFNRGCILNLILDEVDSVVLGPAFLYHWLERPLPPPTPAPTPAAMPTPQPIPPPAVPPGFTRPEVCILRFTERDMPHADSSSSSIVEAHNCMGYYLRLTVNRGCVDVKEGLSRWGEQSFCPARKRQFEQATGTPWASALAPDGEYVEMTVSSLSRIELVYVALEDYVPARGDKARLSLLRTSPMVDTHKGAPPPLAADVIYSTVSMSRPLWYASQAVDPIRVRYAPSNVPTANLATDASNEDRFEAFQLRIGRSASGPTVFGISDLGFYIIDQISVNVSIGDGNFGGMEDWWTPGSNNDTTVGSGDENMTASDELDDLLDDVLKNQTDSVDDILEDLDDAWGNDDNCDGGERALEANETASICGSDLTDPRDIACFCGDLASALAAAQAKNPAVTRIEFGASNGAICSYPPRPANETLVCDARTASWYTQAAYPPHRLVLVIDTMVSDLCDSGRMERAKELGTSLLSTLSPRDFGAVVGDDFSGTYECLRNRLVRTTRPHTIGLLERVASLDTCGDVTYSDTFGRVFEMLRPVEGESSFAACSDLIVFVTGNPDSATQLEEVFAEARARDEPAAVGARLFIFTLLPPEGSNSSATTDRSAYKEILCDQGALGAFINSEGDPLDATDTLFKTLAAENDGAGGEDGDDSSSDITWSADPLSGDLSASQAIYGDAVEGGRTLLGVVRLEISTDVLAAVAAGDNSTTLVGTGELDSLTDSGLNPTRMASLLDEATGGCPNRFCYYLDVRGRIVAQMNDPNAAPVDVPFGQASPLVFEDMLAQGLVATRRVVDWEASTNCTRFQVSELRLRALTQGSGYGAVQRQFGTVGETCLAGYYAFGRVLEDSKLVPKGVAVFLVVINPVGEVGPLGECRAPARVQEICVPFNIAEAAAAVCHALENKEDSSSSGSDGSIVGGLLEAVERAENDDAALDGEAAECRLVRLSQRELDAFRDEDLKCDSEDQLWLIVGISIAICCCLALLMFLCIFAITKRRREEARANETTTIVVQDDGSGGSGSYGTMYPGPSGGLYGEQAGAGDSQYAPSGVSSGGVGYADQAGSDIAYSGHVGYAEQQAGVAPPAARGMYPDAGYAAQQPGVAPDGIGYAGQQAGVAPVAHSQYSGQYADSGYPMAAGAAPDSQGQASQQLHESFALTSALRARRASVTYNNDESFHDSLDDSLEGPGGVAEYGVALPPEMQGAGGDSTSSSGDFSSSVGGDQYATVMPTGLGGGGGQQDSSSDEDSSEYEYETSYSSSDEEDAQVARMAAGAGAAAAAGAAAGGFAATRYDGSSASYSSSSGAFGSDANAPTAADYADLDGTAVGSPGIESSDDSDTSYSSYLSDSDDDDESADPGADRPLPAAPAADYGTLSPDVVVVVDDDSSSSDSDSDSSQPARPVVAALPASDYGDLASAGLVAGGAAAGAISSSSSSSSSSDASSSIGGPGAAGAAHMAVPVLPASDYGDLGPTPRGGAIDDSDSDTSSSSYESDSSPAGVHYDGAAGGPPAVLPADDYGMLGGPTAAGGAVIDSDTSSDSDDSSSSVAGPAVGQPFVAQQNVPVASDYGDLASGAVGPLDSDSSSSSSSSSSASSLSDSLTAGAADYAEVVPDEMRRELSSSETSSETSGDDSDLPANVPPAVDYADLAAVEGSDDTEVDERLLLSDSDSSESVQEERVPARSTRRRRK
jgi:hypothetical protein